MRIYSRAGFTIVELLVVIVVIAILAAISIVSYNGIQKRARDSTMASQLSSTAKAVLVAAADGDLPASLSGIASAPDSMALTYVPDNATKTFCVSLVAADGTMRRIDQAGVQVQGEACNAARNAVVTSLTGQNSGLLPKVTDDSIGTVATMYSSYYEQGSGVPQWVRIDLGSVKQIGYVRVWHFYFDGRTYYNPTLEVSSDGTTWTTISGSGNYKETAAGKLYVFTPQSVRYIRETISGSTANGGNHWIEIQAG